MRIKEYKIPPECRRVSVEAMDNKVIILFEPENAGDFQCALTDHIETEPRGGELSIFWNDEKRDCAIISRLVDEDYPATDYRFKAANETWYKNAVRFRSEDQYRQITGI